jgi:hypothetical protein
MTADRIKIAQSIAQKPFYIQQNLKRSRELSAPYLRYRLFRPLLKAFFRLHRLSYKPSPWIAPAAAAILNKLLKPDMTGFEWGSGSSTVFFARRLKQLTSLEHHQAWFNKVEKWLKEEQIKNVDYVQVSIIYPKGTGETDGYQKAIKEEQVKAYKDYYGYINRFPDGYFDFIMVDGRARVQCGMHALSKLKQGGMLVLDNAERPRYQPLHNALRSWPSVFTTTGLTDTVIWFKP